MSYDKHNFRNNDDRERGRIDLGGLDAPDFRSRIPNRAEEIEREFGVDRKDSRGANGNGNGDDPYDPNEEPEGCLGRFGFSGGRMEWVFLLILVIAAFRGGMDRGGCLPGRNCLNVIFGAAAGIGLMFGGLYLAAETQAGGVATVMACAGGLTCLGSVGGVVLLMLGIARTIDLNPFDDEDGLLSGILGGFLGR